MNSGKKYTLANSFTISEIKNKISSKYTLRKTTRQKGNYVFYDTFDWRLYQQNYLLYSDNNRLYLEKRTTTQPFQILDVKPIPVFITDFPISEMRKILSRIVEMRALLIQAKAHYLNDNYDILDKNGKIILKLTIESYLGIGKILSLHALRGYSPHLVKLLDELDIKENETNQDELYHKILQNNNKTPADYNPRMNIILKPDMPANEAARIIHKNLLHTLKQNEDGILKDIDSEFLHDFRVSSRRTRAALTQIKNVFDPTNTEKYISGFREIGQQTNKIRDLDVYLLTKNEYKKRLPKNMQNHIDPFFEYLQKDRAVEHKKLSSYLKTQKYLNLVNNWENFLSSPASENKAKYAAVPIIDLAIRFIKKQYTKVMELGNKITDNSPDSLLHKLRIQCKKLRYLLEFFSSLFPQNKIIILVNNLKKLQDNLGKFNDLSVQQEFLKQFVANRTFSTDTILAIGYLVGKLNDEQNEVRENFKKSFAVFASIETQNIFTQLFDQDAGRT